MYWFMAIIRTLMFGISLAFMEHRKRKIDIIVGVSYVLCIPCRMRPGFVWVILMKLSTLMNTSVGQLGQRDK